MAGQGRLNHGTVMVVPGEFIQNYAYDANLQTQYEGYAPQGSATSETRWVIRKYTYDANLQVSTIRVAKDVAWDDRSAVSYS